MRQWERGQGTEAGGSIDREGEPGGVEAGGRTHDKGDEHVDGRGDGEAGKDTDRHHGRGVLRLCRSSRDPIEANKRKEDNARAAQDTCSRAWRRLQVHVASISVGDATGTRSSSNTMWAVGQQGMATLLRCAGMHPSSVSPTVLALGISIGEAAAGGGGGRDVRGSRRREQGRMQMAIARHADDALTPGCMRAPRWGYCHSCKVGGGERFALLSPEHLSTHLPRASHQPPSCLASILSCQSLLFPQLHYWARAQLQHAHKHSTNTPRCIPAPTPDAASTTQMPPLPTLAASTTLAAGTPPSRSNAPLSQTKPTGVMPHTRHLPIRSVRTLSPGPALE